MIGRWRAELRDAALEAEFRREQLEANADWVGRDAVVGALVYASFGITDVFALGWTATALGLVALQLGFLGFVLWVRASVRRGPSLLLDAPVAVGVQALALAIMLVVTTARSAEAATNHLSFTLLMLALFVIVPDRLVRVAATTTLAIVGYVLVGLAVYDMDASERATHVMTLVGFGAVGVMAAGQHHRVRREEFLVLREQRRTNALLVDEVERREALESELQWLADHDPLTGVPNRRALLRLAEQAASAARASASHMGVLVIDADRFKDVNDRFGHGIGDLALQRIASVCQSTLRLGDAIGRTGGEEFVVVLPATDLDQSKAMAVRLRDAVAATDPRDGVPALSISVGVATFDPRHDMLEDVVQRADRAMYAAKGAGRGTVECAVDCPSES